MNDEPDDGGWELAGTTRVARNEAGWTLLGGEEDDSGVTLRILVHHPESDELVKRVEARLPVDVDAKGRVAFGPLEVNG